MHGRLVGIHAPSGRFSLSASLLSLSSFVCSYTFNCSRQADVLKLKRLHHMALSDQMDGTLLAAHPMPLCTQMWRNVLYNGKVIVPDLLLDLRQYTLPTMGTVDLDYVSFKARFHKGSQRMHLVCH
jgi:hypothetical protein